MTFDMTWLWSWWIEGTTAVAVVALVVRLQPTLSASTRALVWLATLLTIPCLGLARAAGLDVATLLPALDLAMPTHEAMLPLAGGEAEGDALAMWWLGLATRSAAMVWLVVALLRVSRLAVDVATLVRWRARCQAIDPSAWHRLPVWTCLRGQGRHADVVVSLDVRSPCVLGLWRPVIALPPSALTMRSDTLDAVLAHEYAHVQRHDDIAQFVQHLVSAVCALHPGAWWANRMLDLEREAACDDWAVLLAMPTRTYASTLVTLAAGVPLNVGALSVGVHSRGSQLGGRVRRLVDARRRRRLRPPSYARVAVPAVVALLAAVVTATGHPRATVTPHAASTTLGAAVVPAPDTAPTPPRQATPAGQVTARDVRAPRRPRAAVAARVTRASDAVASPPRPLDVRAGAPPLRSTPVPASMTAPPPAVVPRAWLAAVAVDASPPVSVPDAAPTDASPTPAPAPAPDGNRVAAPFTTAGLSVADAGVSLGRGAARGAVVTGSFFTRLGKRVARTF